jgi:hypothetical protein
MTSWLDEACGDGSRDEPDESAGSAVPGSAAVPDGALAGRVALVTGTRQCAEGPLT